MAITLFNKNVENVSQLSDLPNSEQGLTAAQLKAVFDQAGVDIKDFINISNRCNKSNKCNNFNSIQYSYKY